MRPGVRGMRTIPVNHVGRREETLLRETHNSSAGLAPLADKSAVQPVIVDHQLD
jgi:hypothetical protein